MSIATHEKLASAQRDGSEGQGTAQALYTSLSEVERAKLALLDLCQPDKASLTLVQRHPLTSMGIAFMLGLVVVKSTTLRAIGKAGIHTGMHTLVTRVIRGLL